MFLTVEALYTKLNSDQYRIIMQYMCLPDSVTKDSSVSLSLLISSLIDFYLTVNFHLPLSFFFSPFNLWFYVSPFRAVGNPLFSSGLTKFIYICSHVPW